MRHEVPLGVYVPGDTIIHRIPAGAKIIALIALIIASIFVLTTTLRVTIALAVVTVAFGVARIPARTAWHQIWPTLPLLVMLFAFQWWSKGLVHACVVVGSIAVALGLAFLVTLTTRLSHTMDAIEQALTPLARFGVPTQQIILAIQLTLRLLPLILATAYEVLDARKARGATWSLAAFGVPVITRCLRRARLLADALLARGATDL